MINLVESVNPIRKDVMYEYWSTSMGKESYIPTYSKRCHDNRAKTMVAIIFK